MSDVDRRPRQAHRSADRPRNATPVRRRYGPSAPLLVGAVAVVLLAVGLGPLAAPGLVPGPGTAPDSGGADGPAGVTGPRATAAQNGTGDGTAGVPGLTANGTLNETWLAHRVHEYVNRERRERGLDPLAWSEPLHRAATLHSTRMVREDFFGHVNPETNGTFRDRYDRVGFDCRVPIGGNRYATGAENVAFTYYDERIRLDNGTVVRYETPDELAAGIVRGWMRSEPHRENILREYWQREGIGVAVERTDAGPRVYATQNFC